MTRLDMLRLWVRHKWTIPDYAMEPVRTMSVMGIPWSQIGTQRFERGVSKDGGEPQILLRPDELVMLEGIRRKLSLHERWTSMVSWNMCDLQGRPIRIPTEQEMNRTLMEHRVHVLDKDQETSWPPVHHP